MRFIGLFSLCFIALVAYTSAQVCRGPRNRNCLCGRNVGHGGRGCTPSTMWFWNGRTCEAMRYLGCGGSNNRFCTWAHCMQICRHRI